MKNWIEMLGLGGRKTKIQVEGNPPSVAATWRRTTAWAALLLLLVVGSGHADPPLPVISNQVFVVTNTTFAGGAYGNGSSNSTAAINAAITYASGHGGGTVEIPPVGTLTNYMSGPITMASHVNLQIDSGAKLQMFPMSIWVSNYGSSTPFVNGATLTDTEISGSGIIDGQGTNWWFPLASSRPNFIEFDHCTRVLIQNVTLQNPPTFTIYLKNSDTSVTVQGITINTPFDSHNTDGMDISSTNVLIRNCFISDGDDNLEIGGNGAAATDITVSNCTFGSGHGVSIGSDTEGGVNNLLVSNCTWIGTEYGIKGKSDTDRGGTMQNLVYKDLMMSNVNFAIAFYSYYNTIGSPSSSFTITPSEASTITDSGSHNPIWENITVSNLTATSVNGNVAAFFWGLPQAPITNFTLCKVNINAPTKTFCMYNVRGIQILDSNLTAPNSTTNTLTLYNAQFTVTNSAANANTVSMTGLWGPSNTVVSVFNGLAEAADSGAFGPDPLLTLANSMLTVSNTMSLGGSSKLNYGLGANATKTEVTGNLTLGGTLNVADAGGFANNTTYTLFTYDGTLTYNGLTVGTVPNTNFTYTVSTNTAGLVSLIVGSSCSVGSAGDISGLSLVSAGAGGVAYSISSVGGAASYTWTVPPGASVTSGQGTTSITVNYPCSATSGDVTVTPTNGNCSGASSSLLVTVADVGAAGSISGPASVSTGTNGVNYSIFSVSGATSYTWTVPSGVTIASGQGTKSITVNCSCSAASGNVQVTPGNGNGCIGTASSLPITVTSVGPAGSISGPSSVNSGTNGVSYSISSVSGATTYTWTVPSGATIASGQGTASITVNYSCSASSGNVQVTPGNGNGCTGTAGSLSVTVTSVGAAGSITGSSAVNAGATSVSYSISSVSGATTYTWTVPSGATIASGQGTTSITVNYSCSAVSGNVQVTPGNANGCTGTASSLSVTVTSVGAADSISGATTVCAGQTGTNYSISSVSGATTYIWAVPSGATIASGQGSTSITVNWGSLAGNVTVTPANDNGCTGMGSSLSVGVNFAPSISSGPSPQTVCDGGAASFTVSASGAGLSYRWQKNSVNISDGGTISGSATNTLTLTGVGTGDSGASFDCVVSGTCSPPATSGGATLTVNASPATFNVTGGGSYCAASGGVTVGLDGSESSADYQLELNNNSTGAPVAGTGSPISFTNLTAVGMYTVIASNVTTGCTAAMNGSASVTPGDPFACWQLQYFGCTNCPQAAATADPDGDGQNNMAEFLAGTDPTNSASVLSIISVVESGADVRIAWKTAGGHTNIVQGMGGDANGGYTTNNFTDIPSSQTVVSGSGDTSTNYVDSGGATNNPSRYYRVRLVP
jgi:polygalacturonase